MTEEKRDLSPPLQCGDSSPTWKVNDSIRRPPRVGLYIYIQENKSSDGCTEITTKGLTGIFTFETGNNKRDDFRIDHLMAAFFLAVTNSSQR
jgi:hypothetical protein